MLSIFLNELIFLELLRITFSCKLLIVGDRPFSIAAVDETKAVD